MLKIAFLVTILCAALSIPALSAHADPYSGESHARRTIHDLGKSRSGESPRFEDRNDQRIINDSRRNSDDNFGNRMGDGRSGRKTLGDTVTDQLKPTGRTSR